MRNYFRYSLFVTDIFGTAGRHWAWTRSTVPCSESLFLGVGEGGDEGGKDLVNGDALLVFSEYRSQPSIY